MTAFDASGTRRHFLRVALERPGALFLFLAILGAAGVWTGTRLPSSIFPSVTFPDRQGHRRRRRGARGADDADGHAPARGGDSARPGDRAGASTTSRGSTEIERRVRAGARTCRSRSSACRRRSSASGRTCPPDARVDVEWMNTAIFPILGYALTSDTRSQAELWELAEYTLKPALIRIPGVVAGPDPGRPPARVPGPARSRGARRARGSRPRDVVEAIRTNNDVVVSAGLVEANHELYLSLVDGRAARHRRAFRDRGPSRRGGRPRASLGRSARSRPADAVSVHPNDGRRPPRRARQHRPAALGEHGRDRARRRGALPTTAGPAPERTSAGRTSTTRRSSSRDSVGGARDAILIGVGLAGARALRLPARLPADGDRRGDDPGRASRSCCSGSRRPARRSTS